MIYPGLGLGAILSGAAKMTDKMIIAGTQALAALSPALKNPDDSLLPPFGGGWRLCVFFFFFFVGEGVSPPLKRGCPSVVYPDSRQINFEVALAVIDAAVAEGVSTAQDIPKEQEDRRQWAEKRFWLPVYPEYEYDPKAGL
jgi:malate dehydrogenase (oxaloacetate-decarboxylating)